jgi:predicted DNA binding CopG/RHH family protein
MLPLNPEEQAILDSVENDEWNSVPDRLREIQRYQGYAQAHVAELSAGLEEVRIELPAGDLRSLQVLAQQAGLSVPIFVASLIHQYVSTRSQP